MSGSCEWKLERMETDDTILMLLMIVILIIEHMIGGSIGRQYSGS